MPVQLICFRHYQWHWTLAVQNRIIREKLLLAWACLAYTNYRFMQQGKPQNWPFKFTFHFDGNVWWEQILLILELASLKNHHQRKTIHPMCTTAPANPQSYWYFCVWLDHDSKHSQEKNSSLAEATPVCSYFFSWQFDNLENLYSSYHIIPTYHLE